MVLKGGGRGPTKLGVVPLERGTFLTVLHRLFVSGSDRAGEKWRADYRIEGTEGLQLHHLYRVMAWLGEPLADQTGASGLVPRCRTDLVEEELFARRRDLFAELSVVFMDTTSLSFEGKGGEELGRRGHSKDHRPARLCPIGPSLGWRPHLFMEPNYRAHLSMERSCRAPRSTSRLLAEGELGKV
jgi:hypothetical protein